MERVIVIGCPGAGKSTFARGLRNRTGLPLYYLDRLWHRPDRTTVSPAQFDAQMNEILAQPRWILDGNYQRTLRHSLFPGPAGSAVSGRCGIPHRQTAGGYAVDRDGI